MLHSLPGVSFSALTLLIGQQEGAAVVCSFVGLAPLIALVSITSIILSCSKIQNGDILVPANPHLSGKWPLKRRESLPDAMWNYHQNL